MELTKNFVVTSILSLISLLLGSAKASDNEDGASQLSLTFNFQGNQFLKIKIKLVNQPEPSPSPTDIILESDGIQISLSILAQGNSLPDESYKEYVFRLHEHPDYSWQPTQSFQQFMSILSNLTAIKIRSSYSDGGQAFLNVVELETAHRTWDDGTKIYKGIEECHCPEGYFGQYCEACAPMYRRSPANGDPLSSCIPCDCNGEICESETGRCHCSGRCIAVQQKFNLQ